MILTLTHVTPTRKKFKVVIDANEHEYDFSIETLRINGKRWPVDNITQDSKWRIIAYINNHFDIKDEIDEEYINREINNFDSHDKNYYS